ncbi:hypothetical protein, partial [Lentimicrobium sp.]|uniref:hypothetical protein n=1 Tax=Lentimicrobium sp. TaxID=2034841 RepID=UPI00345E531C
MKRIILICLIAAICCIQLQGQAQLLGKWVIPTGNGNSPEELLVLKFMMNEPVQYAIIAIPGGLITAADQIGDGAFDSNYELDFSMLSDYLFYDDENILWNGGYGSFMPECQIITRPHYPGEYFLFHGEFSTNKNLDANLYYNHVWFENNQIQIGPETDIIVDCLDGSSIAFAITDYSGNDIRIYNASRAFTYGIGNTHSAGLRYFSLSENGVDPNSIEDVITPANSSFTEMDFDSYNLEMKVEGDGSHTIAWINQNTLSNSMVYVVADQNYKHDLDMGRIGGIEFSSLNPTILYVSCPDSGIVALNYTSGEHSVLPNSQDFGHTFLQTAPDGHIYALNDGGYILGRISMQDGSFDPDCFTVPNSYMVSTFRVFDNTNYYILPENHRRYNPLIVTVDTIPESCPGYADGSAIICVSGGTPAAPPDPEYNITCTGPGGNSIDYDYYDPATGCFHFENLTAGFYTFSITDDIGTFYE